MTDRVSPVGSFRSRLVGLAASTGLLVLVLGTPLLLVTIGANPASEPFSGWDGARSALTQPDDGTLFLRAVALIAWLAWALMAALIVLEIVSLARGVAAPRLPGLRLSQSLARSAVSTAALLFVAAPLVLQPDPAVVLTSSVSPVLDPPSGATGSVTVPALAQTPRASKSPATKSHPVKAGDTLWSIARTHLDDGARYPEIADLNPDVLGADPGFLEVGWVLQVPIEPDPIETENNLAPGERVVTVKQDQTLSGIAENELDDADAYPRIVEASKSIVQPGGARLVDPDVIDVGWQLIIPTSREAEQEQAPAERDEPRPERHPEQAPPAPPVPSETAPPPTEPSGAAEPAAPDHAIDDRADDRADDSDRDDQAREADAPPWLLLGLTGGGVVLAASLYRTLQARRRAQWRARRPGRAIALPGPELAPVEKTINHLGPTTSVTIDGLDDALKQLAHQRATADEPMPSLAAVEISQSYLILHLTEPTDLTGEKNTWEGTADHLHWRRDRSAEVEPHHLERPAPYPLLVTIGSDGDGNIWLLNCEELGTLTITGDLDRSADFTRYLAAELAVNRWSHGVQVDCIGVAHEVVSMNKERIHFHSADAPDQVGALMATIRDDIEHTVRRADGIDVTSHRSSQTGEDVWPARILLIDTRHWHQRPTELDGLDELASLAINHPGHSGTAVLIVHGHDDTPGSVLELTSDGRVRLAEAGLDLAAVGLSSDEAQGCALLLAQAAVEDDVELSTDTSATGWEAFCAQTGMLRPEFTKPRGADDHASAHASDHVSGDDSASLLPEDDEPYLESAATTPEDLETLAPEIPGATRKEIAASDLTLDADLDAWFDPTIRRPRLSLLGPVSVKAYGNALASRKAFYTELLTYLALRRRHGATIDEVANAFNLKAQRVRVDVKTVRDWLGTNPDTGAKHLPDAQDAPSSKFRGVNVYQVDDGLLIDAELFKRLWVRGQSRGPDGINDLRRALDLVTGRPFQQLRPNGWRWMDEGERVDMTLQVAVADVAHLVTTHALEAGDLTLARFAVEKAIAVSPDEDTTQLNRAALAYAEGRDAEAERILREEICDRSDDGLAPHDLTARADAILRNHNWLAAG